MNSTLLLIKMDAMDLMERLKERRKEALQEFSLKRDRAVFQELFFTRFYTVSIPDMSSFDSETLIAIHHFYKSVEKLRWYLMHTQDMLNKIEDIYLQNVKSIEKSYEAMILFMDASLSEISSPPETFATET